jgi:hypothetical protein
VFVTPTLGDTARKFVTVSITCDRCDIAGTFATDEILAFYGPDIAMQDLRHRLAQCPRRDRLGEACGVSYVLTPNGEHIDPRRPAEDDWARRTIAQAQADGYTHLRIHCQPRPAGCGNIVDMPWELIRRPPETLIGALRPFLRCTRCGAGAPEPTIGVTRQSDAQGYWTRR